MRFPIARGLPKFCVRSFGPKVSEAKFYARSFCGGNCEREVRGDFLFALGEDTLEKHSGRYVPKFCARSVPDVVTFVSLSKKFHQNFNAFPGQCDFASCY